MGAEQFLGIWATQRMADKFAGGMQPGSTGTLKTPQGEEIEVGLPTGEIGGSRHYKGATLGRVEMWKCVQCSAENTGDISKGCAVCGAGSAQPRHVGVPPKPKDVPLHYAPEVERPPTSVEDAFHDWLKRVGYDPRNTEVVQLLYHAWISAIAWYIQQQGTQPRVEQSIDPNMIPVPRELLIRILGQLEDTTDTDSGEQSETLLALISQLRELIDGRDEQGRGTEER